MPAYLLVGFVAFLMVYSGLNFMLVPDIDDPRNIKGTIIIHIYGKIILREKDYSNSQGNFTKGAED